MKRLPLSLKVALWSFLVAGLAIGSAMLVTTLVLERELMAPIKERLGQRATEIFWNLDHYAGGPAETLPTITKEMMPRTVANMQMEILGAGGELLYRSANLKNKLTLMGGPETPHEVLLFKLPYHVETFHHGALTLLIGQPLTPTYLILKHVKTAGLYALPIAGVLSLLGGYWVASRAMKPVRAILEAARRISVEDLHQRLPVPAARDDLRLLTNVLNDTFDRLERSYLQAVRFAADASHQLKTPVTVMRAAIEDMLRDPELRPADAAALNDVLDQTRRLSSLAEGLLVLATADAGGIGAELNDTDIIPIIERCLEDAEILAAEQEVRILRDLPDRLYAVADLRRSEQVLLNLLENAIKYNRPGGIIQIRAGSRRDGVFITVANTGTPIPAARTSGIFNRFARGDQDESRTGHGLGLSIARELAAAQRGDVRLLRSDSAWTEFEFRLSPTSSRKPDGQIVPLMTPPATRALLRNPG